MQPTQSAIDPETHAAEQPCDLRPSHLKALRQLHAGTSAELLNTMTLRGLMARGLVGYAGGLRELTDAGRAVCAALFGEGNEI